MVLDADGRRAGGREAVDGAPQVRRAAEARVAVDDQRHAAGRGDALPRNLLHFDAREDAGVGLAAARGDSEAAQEEHIGAGFREDARRQRVVHAWAQDGAGRLQDGAQLCSGAQSADRAQLHGSGDDCSEPHAVL